MLETITLISIVFIATIDSGIVNPARSTIANSLNVGEDISSWMVSLFVLGIASSMLIFGVLSKRFGMTKVLKVSVILFTIFSIFCGLDNFIHSFWFLIISRFVQGIFGGGLIPLSNAYISNYFPSNRKGIVMGYIGTTYAISNLLGPLLGSIILDVFGNSNWHMLFFINIIFGVISYLLISKYLIVDKNIVKEKIEPFSILFSTLGVFFLINYISNVDLMNLNSLISFNSVINLSIFIICTFFAYLSIKKFKGPLFDLFILFKMKYFIIGSIITFVVGLCMFTITINLPQIIEVTLGISNGKGGYYLILVGLSGILFGPFTGKILQRYGEKKSFVLTIIGVTITLVLIVVAIVKMSLIVLVLGLLVYGIASNFLMITIPTYIVSKYVDTSLQISAQSLLALIRSFGLCIGPILGSLFIKSANNEIYARGLAKVKSVIHFNSGNHKLVHYFDVLKIYQVHFTYLLFATIILILCLSFVNFMLKGNKR